MSAVIRAASVTSRCAWKPCGRRFEQPAELLLKGEKRLFCGDDCGRAAVPDRYCQACDRPRNVDKPAYGCLPICYRCYKLAYWSCWRKRSFPTFYSAKEWGRVFEAAKRLRNPLTPYACALCERWHNSSWNPWDVAPEEYLERVTDLAVVFHEFGFDIDLVRGWANNPDGTHLIVDDDIWRVPDEILALIG